MAAGEHYRSQRQAATDLYRGLDDQQLATVVPGCPEWTVRDALSHLVGLPTDVNSGVVDGAGSPPWTGKQVADRTDRSVDELLREWDEQAPALEAVLADLGVIGWRCVIDLTMHVDDVREALDLPAGDAPTNRVVLDALVNQAGRRADGVGTLTIRSGDEQWVIGAGEPSDEVRVDEAGELARVLGGRRTDDQVRGLDWTGDAERWVPVLPLFRDAD